MIEGRNVPDGQASPSGNATHDRRIGRVVLSRRTRSDYLYAFAFLTPCLVILGVIVFYPLAKVLALSLHNASLLMAGRQQFVGLENFIELFTRDSVFPIAIVNTLEFTVFSVAGGFIVGFALALVLNERIPLRNFFRGVALIPWVIPGVIVALLTLYMFNGEVGIVNYTLHSVGIIRKFIPWFANERAAMWALIVVNVWNQAPFYMLMLLAGLQTRPEELVEAAKMDGAGTLIRFWHITLPHLREIIMIITALMVIWNFNNFDLIWTATEGGPVDATMTLSVYTYRQAFLSFRMGYATAIAVIWLLGLLAFSVFYVRVMEGRRRA